MEENDRDLLLKHAKIFSCDLDLTGLIPLLMSSGLWRDVNQEQLNVIPK